MITIQGALSRRKKNIIVIVSQYLKNEQLDNITIISQLIFTSTVYTALDKWYENKEERLS